MKTEINQAAAGWILQRRYLLAQRGVRRSRWRRIIAVECVKTKAIESDTFCRTWEQLEDQGLI